MLFQGNNNYKILAVFILFCLLSFVFLRKQIFIGGESHVPLAKITDNELTQNDEITGVSGKLFTGIKMREYQGEVLFSTMDTSKLLRLAASNRKASQSAVSCKNWGVVTTINEPTDAVLNLAKLNGWCVVVVGDKKTPMPYTIPHELQNELIYLGVDDQENLVDADNGVYSELLSLTPWNHFGRKNLGFLFAIQQGAKLIFDFDDDNVIHPEYQTFEAPTKGYLLETKCTAFNHHDVMGAPTTPNWPRGFPLDRIKKPCEMTVKPHGTEACSVFQSLANIEPDIDAIYRLTQPCPFNFLAEGGKIIGTSTLVIPSGTLIPYNAQATLFKEEAFWSLLLPITVHGRVSDIWRSYFSQPLLWSIRKHLAFMAPRVNQYRNEHNHLRDFQAENDLYLKSGSLVNFLASWNTNMPSNSTLPSLMETLFIDLYERDYIKKADVRYCQAWLSALLNVGYKFPDIKFDSHNAAPEEKPILVGSDDVSKAPEEKPILVGSDDVSKVYLRPTEGPTDKPVLLAIPRIP